MPKIEGINPHSKPTGTGCAECLATGGWWLHLRRCAECGHIGCCDSSPGQHERHAFLTGHPIVASFEPLQHWFYDYGRGRIVKGIRLAAPRSRPESQPAPGPEGKVPEDWESLLHDLV
jgi:Zn-finger in ubiquitin-hydrolases and other protein